MHSRQGIACASRQPPGIRCPRGGVYRCVLEASAVDGEDVAFWVSAIKEPQSFASAAQASNALWSNDDLVRVICFAKSSECSLGQCLPKVLVTIKRIGGYVYPKTPAHDLVTSRWIQASKENG
jgi:hypothetical protein